MHWQNIGEIICEIIYKPTQDVEWQAQGFLNRFVLISQ